MSETKMQRLGKIPVKVLQSCFNTVIAVFFFLFHGKISKIVEMESDAVSQFSVTATTTQFDKLTLDPKPLNPKSA